jgi:hypothetical protein
MSIYPPGPLTPLQASLIADGVDTHIWYTSGESTFHMGGGFSPVAPGVPGQDGIIIKSIKGICAPPFKHKDLQGAHQDGVTWTATDYDPAQMSFELEAHAVTPEGLSALVAEWQGSWNPRNPGTLESTTLDGGYWYCQARLEPKSWGDQYTLMPRRVKMQKLNHSCRIDDTFWSALDSVDRFGWVPSAIGDDFTTAHSSGLGSSWTTTYSGGHTGIIHVPSTGGVFWSDTGNSTQWVTNQFNTALTSDFQAIRIVWNGSRGGLNLGGGAYNDIIGRWDGSDTYVRARISWTGVTISRFNSGTETVMQYIPLTLPPLSNEPWTFILGAVLDEPRSFALLRNDHKFVQFTEYGTGSALGSGFRYIGFGMQTAFNALGMQLPAPVASFFGVNHTQETHSGFVGLLNIGTEDAWPRYLCYGPGTFTFQDGPRGSKTITLGPLLDHQIALVVTLPRLRSVVDLSPGAPPPPHGAVKLLKELQSFVFNNNVPPLLEKFESRFGILPPQGQLYSLLNGRFTNPIPGVAVPSMAQPANIAVSITDGTALSKVVAAITPMRICPT